MKFTHTGDVVVGCLKCGSTSKESLRETKTLWVNEFSIQYRKSDGKAKQPAHRCFRLLIDTIEMRSLSTAHTMEHE